MHGTQYMIAVKLHMQCKLGVWGKSLSKWHMFWLRRFLRPVAWIFIGCND
jgi:hypothetical protein